ncbi:MAG: hypothetical protein KKA65_03285 [Nanoarchaeota archaeon]|nr:hypothetical protein [Nanoarchaeota archaeon]MBU4352018.1 hypothetical protein [Nanoarchaeota archaeon]MBU4456501.1 hypothetical protein [Nanoarchaeota archaeon]MCG2719323.1 hypothetical protein [Nanoarchaeota archaeon]
MSIKYLGTKDLDDFEVVSLKKIVEQGYAKLQNYESQLGNIELTVHVKVMNDQGRAKVFDVSLKLSSKKRSGTFDVRNEEWDLKKSLHGAFAALEINLQHTLKLK